MPLARAFARLTRMYYGALTNSLEGVDFDRHFSVLIAIEEGKGLFTQQHVAELLGIDKVSMVRILDVLSKKGLIIRKPNELDRRAHCLEITTKALQVLPKIKDAIRLTNQKALEGLNDNDRELFYSVLEKVTLNLNELPQDKVKVNFKRIKK